MLSSVWKRRSLHFRQTGWPVRVPCLGAVFNVPAWVTNDWRVNSVRDYIDIGVDARMWNLGHAITEVTLIR